MIEGELSQIIDELLPRESQYKSSVIYWVHWHCVVCHFFHSDWQLGWIGSYSFFVDFCYRFDSFIRNLSFCLSAYVFCVGFAVDYMFPRFSFPSSHLQHISVGYLSTHHICCLANVGSWPTANFHANSFFFLSLWFSSGVCFLLSLSFSFPPIAVTLFCFQVGVYLPINYLEHCTLSYLLFIYFTS
ncbi:hypothetical protein BDF19DRAFT_110345 [Syncephalis fuscata]|nr:hypothetical protein BDF19DRAFT_110345 [Syncephalis fuscata]